MVGQTLHEIRSRVLELAAEDGRYRIVCGRTGDRFVPIDGLRFPTRTAADEAARLAERYRAALRRYDPQLPCHDPIARECAAHTSAPESRDRCDRPTGGPPFDAAARRRPSSLIEYCHDVAAVVFEQLTERGHRGVETAVVDAYLERAEATPDRDRLCVELLRCTAFELDARLSVAEQERVLSAAAAQLPDAPAETASRAGIVPIETTLEHLRSKAVVDSYAVGPSPRGGTDSWTVTLSDYAFGTGRTRVPTLPLVVDLLRRHSASPAVVSAASDDPGEWRLEVSLSADSTPRGLATATATRP